MENLFQYLVDILPEYDKVYHLIYGFLLSFIYFMIRKDPGIPFILLISMIKEIIDLYLGKEFRIDDILFSTIPSLFLFAILIRLNILEDILKVKLKRKYR